MRIAIGSDHAGYALKAHLSALLATPGHQIENLGAHSEEPTDYPAVCAAVGRLVTAGKANRGIVLGGSGQGEQIAANKVSGVRAALCNDLYTARMRGSTTMPTCSRWERGLLVSALPRRSLPCGSRLTSRWAASTAHRPDC